MSHDKYAGKQRTGKGKLQYMSSTSNSRLGYETTNGAHDRNEQADLDRVCGVTCVNDDGARTATSGLRDTTLETDVFPNLHPLPTVYMCLVILNPAGVKVQ